MKHFILTLLLTMVLIMGFSILGPQIEVVTSPRGYGTQVRGDSGQVLPGDGTEPVEATTPPETSPETEPVAEVPTTEVPSETVVSEVTTITIKKEEPNIMSEILTAFWHGVAVVILGEVAAILIAIAWMKIKDGKGR